MQKGLMAWWAISHLLFDVLVMLVTSVPNLVCCLMLNLSAKPLMVLSTLGAATFAKGFLSRGKSLPHW